MDTSDVCPTEDAIDTLLEHLVDPLLPAKPSARDNIPSQAQQESVAKQVHAVVLLYNYYHRRKHPDLEYLGFEKFCKLAGDLRRILLVYMKKLLQRSGDAEGKQLSLLEKIVMDACEICMSLEASKNLPWVEGWPIKKVAIFLVDSEKKNCYLQFGSITQGLWSLIEKDTDVSHRSSECTLGEKHVEKKKRVTKTKKGDEQSNNEFVNPKVAFSAVEEATGINRSDVMIMDSHIVYSLSKEKTAVHLYVMQCTSKSTGDVINVPIEDTIHSLQGPLLQKSSSGWTCTSVVEYFHVLPYASFLSDRLSRPVVSNCVRELATESESTDIHGYGRTNIAQEAEVQMMTMDDKKGPICSALSGLPNGDATDHCMMQSQNGDMCLNVANRVQAKNPEKTMHPCIEVESNAKNNCSEVEFDSRVVPHIAEHRDIEVDGREFVYGKPYDVHTPNPATVTQQSNLDKPHSVYSPNTAVVTHQSNSDKPCSVHTPNPARVSHQSNLDKPCGVQTSNSASLTHQSNLDLERLQATFASKETLLSETAWRALLSKRDKLILQHRDIEDQIAKCDKSIQTIIRGGGGEEDLALKLESIIEVCNDVCLRTVTRETAFQQSPDKSTCQFNKRKKLSEAVLFLNPLMELDAICYGNNWILPTYCVSPSNGGFKARVSLKDVDFEFSASGDQTSNSHEARESAASRLLANLRSIGPTTFCQLKK